MRALVPYGVSPYRFALGGLKDLGRMRELVRRLLLDCDQADIIDAVLVADEIGTLACQYGDLPGSVDIERELGEPVLRIAVTAGRLGLPSSPSRLETTRRVFDNCATGWGIDDQGAEMTMWAEIALPSTPRHDGFPLPRVSSC
jgi:hypothetical protein